MQVVQNRLQARKPKLTIQQILFLGLKGFGHLAAMMGAAYLIGSVMYIAVDGANFINVLTGLLIIAAGYHFQKLGDKLEERHVLQADHLTIDIQKIATRALTISIIVIAIIFI